jgi:hypothetical protein
MIKHPVVVGTVVAIVLNGACSHHATQPAIESSQPQVSPTSPPNARPATSRPSPANSSLLNRNAPGATWATTPEMTSGFDSPGPSR